MIREMREETGLEVKIKKLLYVCDKPDASPSLLHITFLLERIEGEIKLPSNEFDHNPIHDVQMVPINELSYYGFGNFYQSYKWRFCKCRKLSRVETTYRPVNIVEG